MSKWAVSKWANSQPCLFSLWKTLFLFFLFWFSLPLHTGSEFALSLQIAHFKKRLWSIRSLKKSDVSDLLEKFVFFICFFPKSESLTSLFTKERPFAQVAHNKRAKVRFAQKNERIVLLLRKNKWFAWKTDEQIPNPALHAYYELTFVTIFSEYIITLLILHIICYFCKAL